MSAYERYEQSLKTLLERLGQLIGSRVNEQRNTNRPFEGPEYFYYILSKIPDFHLWMNNHGEQFLRSFRASILLHGIENPDYMDGLAFQFYRDPIVTKSIHWLLLDDLETTIRRCASEPPLEERLFDPFLMRVLPILAESPHLRRLCGMFLVTEREAGHDRRMGWSGNPVHFCLLNWAYLEKIQNRALTFLPAEIFAFPNGPYWLRRSIGIYLEQLASLALEAQKSGRQNEYSRSIKRLYLTSAGFERWLIQVETPSACSLESFR